MKNILSKSYRVLALSIAEEINLIKRDFGAWLILLIAVVVYPFVYSVVYYPGVLHEIPIAVVDNDQSTLSRKALNMLDAAPQLHVANVCPDMTTAKELFRKNQVNGIIYIPHNLEKSVYNDTPEKIAVYCDASFFLIYKESLLGSMKTIGTLSAGVEIKKLMVKGVRESQAFNRAMPIDVKVNNLFNYSSSYSNYVLPALFIVIIQQTLLIGIGLVAGSRREQRWRKGNQSIMVTPKGYFWLVTLGRSIIYILISLFNIVFNFVFISYLFHLPFAGNFIDVLYIMIPFVLSTTFLGIAISQVFRAREHSIIFLAFLSPIVLFLTGMSWPKFMIPDILNWVATIIPSTHIVPAYIRIRAMGVNFSDVKPEFYSMLLLTVVYYALASIALRIRSKRIKKAPVSK